MIGGHEYEIDTLEMWKRLNGHINWKCGKDKMDIQIGVGFVIYMIRDKKWNYRGYIWRVMWEGMTQNSIIYTEIPPITTRDRTHWRLYTATVTIESSCMWYIIVCIMYIFYRMCC